MHDATRPPLVGSTQLRVTTSDPQHDADFAAAAARVLRATRAVPPFGTTAAEASGPAHVTVATAIAAAALTLGEPRVAAATLRATAAATHSLGRLPATLDARSFSGDEAGAATAALAASPAAAAFAALAARYLAHTADLAVGFEVRPILSRLLEQIAEGKDASRAAGAIVAAARDVAEATGQRVRTLTGDERPIAITRRNDETTDDPAADTAILARAVGAGSALAAAATVLDTLGRTFGFRPDATRHRVELRLAAPPAWSRATVVELIVGDAALSCEYRRTDSGARLRIEQTAGAVPLRAVLEPLVHATTVRSCRIDGRVADLEARSTGENRWIVPVQLSLEAERILEIDLD
jgi:hypothetical protein